MNYRTVRIYDSLGFSCRGILFSLLVSLEVSLPFYRFIRFRREALDRERRRESDRGFTKHIESRYLDYRVTSRECSLNKAVFCKHAYIILESILDARASATHAPFANLSLFRVFNALFNVSGRARDTRLSRSPA